MTIGSDNRSIMACAPRACRKRSFLARVSLGCPGGRRYWEPEPRSGRGLRLLPRPDLLAVELRVRSWWAYSCPMTRPLTNWHSAHAEQLTRGERAADRLRNGMGSWFFIGGFVVFMIVWAAVNVTAVTWDPYPYILLTCSSACSPVCRGRSC